MRRSDRIEQAALAVVNTTGRAHTAALAALRDALAIEPQAGHQPQYDHAAALARYDAGESQAAIARSLGVKRAAICKLVNKHRK